MNDDEDDSRTASRSPRLTARLAGLLYLLIFVAAPSGAKTATPTKMIITLACDIGVTLLLYALLKPVNKPLALTAAAFRLIFVVIMATTSLNYFGAFALFQPSRSAAAFNFGYGISLLPFGIHCLLTGLLIFKSTFLPRTIGVLMAIAGLAYLLFLSPQLADRLFIPWIVIPAVLGEGSLTLWLLIMAVNAKRWPQQASTR